LTTRDLKGFEGISRDFEGYRGIPSRDWEFVRVKFRPSNPKKGYAGIQRDLKGLFFNKGIFSRDLLFYWRFLEGFQGIWRDFSEGL
jgi:hypothetical protein